MNDTRDRGTLVSDARNRHLARVERLRALYQASPSSVTRAAWMHALAATVPQ